MVILFGAPGAGKSIQGQILAARHGWRWLSAGQLLRDARNPKITKEMATGGLVDDGTANRVVSEALGRSKDISHVILDGFPRELSQAKWLVENQPHHGRSISLVLVLEVPHDELMRRLELRGRLDDSSASRQERLKIYNENIRQVTAYFKEQQVSVVHVSGVGTVGEVHDRIESELATWHLL